MGVICKYYQQGRCRFGNQCKFQHSDGFDDGDDNRGGRLGDQYHYYKPEKPDVNVILQAVQQEIVTSEKGKQWPLSCFAPLKDYGNIAGWDDISPEELRWQTYLSRQSGNLDECIKLIQEAHHKAKINKNAMLNPTIETYSVLESIFTKDNASTSGGFGSGLSVTITNSGSFASPQQGQPGTSIFGGSTGGFGAAANASQSAFNTVAAGHSSSIFGGTPASPAQPTSFFGASAPSPSVFGNASSALSRNVFGNVPTVAPTNIFGNTPSVAPSPANVFGAGAHSASIFGGQQAQPPGQILGGFNSAIGQTFQNTPQQQTSAFQNATPGAFGNANTFGSNQNTVAVAADGTYTAITEMSEEVLALYTADKFVMGKIPTVPPPRELCF